jgi:TDG/mug DNA glycosylase family protein
MLWPGTSVPVGRRELGQGVEDILAPGLAVVFCGLNPAATAAASGHNFSSRSNRFWPVLQLAGFTPHRIAAADECELLRYGCGITALVGRATREGREVSRAEFRAAEAEFTAKIERYKPRWVAFLGKAGVAALAGRAPTWGRQEVRIGGAQVWVLPNPSGLNRAFPLEALVAAYRELHEEVG